MDNIKFQKNYRTKVVNNALEVRINIYIKQYMYVKN